MLIRGAQAEQAGRAPHPYCKLRQPHHPHHRQELSCCTGTDRRRLFSLKPNQEVTFRFSPFIYTNHIHPAHRHLFVHLSPYGFVAIKKVYLYRFALIHDLAVSAFWEAILDFRQRFRTGKQLHAPPPPPPMEHLAHECGVVPSSLPCQLRGFLIYPP